MKHKQLLADHLVAKHKALFCHGCKSLLKYGEEDMHLKHAYNHEQTEFSNKP